MGLGLLLLSVACGGDARTPTGLGGGSTGPPGRGGTGPTGTAAEALVGEWLNTLIVSAGTDFQRIETRWRFETSACSRTVQTFSVTEDILRTSRRECTWSVNQDLLTVDYTDATESIRFDLRFLDFSRDRMMLGEFVFIRVF